jgi:membrane protein
MGEDDATHMAASVSYYAVLSLFPLVLALTAIIGWVAGSETRQDQLIEFVVDNLPGSEQFVRDSVAETQKFREALGVVAVLGLFWSASAVFGSITRVVNRAWDVRQNPPFYKNKPRQLAMALGVSTLFVISITFTSFLQWATSIEIGGQTVSNLLGGQVFAIILRLPALFISVSIFLVIYKYLPNTKTYWRDVWLGALLAALLFEVGKNLFLWYLKNFAQFEQLYGNVASVIILMVWTYFCAFILIFGAELSSEYGRIKRGVQRGQLIPESTDSN